MSAAASGFGAKAEVPDPGARPRLPNLILIGSGPSGRSEHTDD